MRRWGVCVLVLMASGCRKDGASDAEKPGRSWTTPALEAADGGLAAQKFPRVSYRGGPFLRNPRIVTITFKKDDPGMVARLEQFGDVVTRTRWWREVVDSYCAKPDDCIGEGRAGSHVHLEEALPAEVRDVDVDALLAREAKAAHLGSIGPDTLLAVYLPKDVALSDRQNSRFCSGGPRAFHRSLDLGKTKVPYAVLPRCSDEAELTATASHEILEATTNPDPGERGFAFESGSAAAGFTHSGLEPVDPCGLITMDSHWTMDSGFFVQRAWSNRAASLGRDPCVPARAGRPYVALVPEQPAVRLAKEGESAIISLEAASDGEVPSWAISAFDLSGYQEHQHYVDVALDRPTVRAGDKATLTITLRKRSANERSVVAIVSTLGVHSHMWPLPVVMR